MLDYRVIPQSKNVRKVKKFKILVDVWCDGDWHTIGISKKGRFAIIVHKCNLGNWLARYDGWKDLGGAVPQCIYEILAMRKFITTDRGEGLDRVSYPGIYNAKTTTFRGFLLECIEKRRVR